MNLRNCEQFCEWFYFMTMIYPGYCGYCILILSVNSVIHVSLKQDESFLLHDASILDQMLHCFSHPFTNF
jgi:hypothetical protein